MKTVSQLARRYAKLAFYYSYKALHRILSEALCSYWHCSRGAGLRFGLLRPHGIYPVRGDSLSNGVQPKFSNKIVFAFWDSSLVHLGDMLFHVPLAEALVKQGYELTIVGGGGLASYFKALNFNVVPLEEWRSTDHEGVLVISKNDMLLEVARRISKPAYFLGLDYAFFEGSEPVTLALLRATVAVLDLLDPAGLGQAVFIHADFTPRVPESLVALSRDSDWWQTISKDPNKKWLLFNPYVASNYLLTIGKVGMLTELAKHKRQTEGYGIILTGSAGEKASDSTNYPFVDLDLRGRLKPTELIALGAHPQVIGSISFDTFAMHAASLSRKDLYVAIKNILAAELFRKRFVPMFPGGEDLVKLCA